MFEELTKIRLSGKEYPVKCDLLVLEKIQDAYGNITDFEDGLRILEPVIDENGKKVKVIEPVVDKNGEMVEQKEKTKYSVKWPRIKNLRKGLYWMACEGEAITADIEKRPPESIDEMALFRSVDIPVFELADILHAEFNRCFETKSKNVETT